MQELEQSASADIEVRDKISNFPREVGDGTSVDEIKSTTQARALLSEVTSFVFRDLLVLRIY